jgi:hypothetical protein
MTGLPNVLGRPKYYSTAFENPASKQVSSPNAAFHQLGPFSSQKQYQLSRVL